MLQFFNHAIITNHKGRVVYPLRHRGGNRIACLPMQPHNRPLIIMMMAIMVWACLLAMPFTAHAIEPSEQLADKTLEARARDISASLRCLVCQNQTIDDSNADIAKTLRAVVRERILAGDSNDQTIDYIVGKYGHFVLMKPPIIMGTLALWLSPLLFGALGVFILWRFYRKNNPETELSAEQVQLAKQKLQAMK